VSSATTAACQCRCSNHITSSSKASSSLLHGKSLLIWRLSVLKCINRVVLAPREFILWIVMSVLVLNSWMWALIVKTLLVGHWSISFVLGPIGVIVFINVISVISLNIWKNYRFGFPFVIVFCASLRQSVVVVKGSLERILFVVFLSRFIFLRYLHL